MGVLVIPEYESIVKIEVVPLLEAQRKFLEALVPFFERISGVAPERWVVRAQRHFHPVSRQILDKDSAI